MRKAKLIAGVLAGLGLFIVLIFFLIGYLKPKIAGIYIEANPPSSVFINGEYVGRTPYRETRNPGEIVVKVIPDYFQTQLVPYETKVTLVSGVETVIKRDFAESEDASSGQIISFEKIGRGETSLSVVTIPDSAQLIIDGQIRAFTPYKTSTISPGEHALTFSAKGYRDEVIKVKTHAGFKLTAVVQLAKGEEALIPTPTPSPSAIIMQEVEILPTTTGFLRVRSEPSTLSPEVGRVAPGQRFRLLEIDENTGWYKIAFEEAKEGLPAQAGWISSEFAKIIDEGAQVSPTLTPVLTPTSAPTKAPTPTATSSPTPTP